MTHVVPLRRRGLTYVETIVSTVILAVAVTASLRATGLFAFGERAADERVTANELANQLMAEINAWPFKEPGGNAAIGVNSGENAAVRTTFDDIDDFHGWKTSPPQDRLGNVMNDYTGYSRSVLVVYDNGYTAAPGIGLSTGKVKRITVIVKKGDRQLATLDAYRTEYD